MLTQNASALNHTHVMNSSTDPSDPATGPQPLPPSPLSVKPLSIRVMGAGGAGGNLIGHIAKSDLRDLRPIALHTSARILATLDIPEKVLLGADLTQGLGAGGDPSLARAAAEQDQALLKRLCADVDLLFLVAGLGGGTGTGVAPVLARIAKECGALVLAVGTLPFDIEGARRRRQADQGLGELIAAADAVICLPNQKMFRVVDENTSVMESLKITNDLLAQGIRGVWQMLTRPSLIHVDFAALRAVLRDRHGQSSFATVEARGEGRSREVIEQLLASPLLDGGEALNDADAVLVNLVGGPDLCMADVKRVMEEINRRTDNANLVMGASIDEGWQGRLGLTLIASRRTTPPRIETLSADRLEAAAALAASTAPPEVEHRFLKTAEEECGRSRFAPPPPQLTMEQRLAHADAKAKASPRRLLQTHLPLEIISKGRFEKSQPTIVRGEDLDVPTYVRRGIPLN
jgi:cell division protein FtsZ